MLRCRNWYLHRFGWNHTRLDGTVYRIAYDLGHDCEVLSRFSSVYSVVGDDLERECDLVIHSTNSSETGRYTCYDFRYSASANVTIIGELFNLLRRSSFSFSYG